MADQTPYSTAAPLLGKLPDFVNDEIERQRIAAYALYEAMYWNIPGTFSIKQRGSNADPIYIPAARQIVETFNRFLAPGLQVVVDPAFGTSQEQELAAQVWADFSAREKWYSKFNTGKRYGLIRGDWAWHLYADPLREEGSRVSAYQVDPGSLFPIYNPLNIDEIIGWHIIDQVLDDTGKALISRQTYLKETMMGGPSPIIYSKALYEVDDWGGPGMEEPKKIVRMEVPPFVLPAPIDALPIYVIPNFDEPGALWGASELRGVERLIGGLNQSISDEDLALALEGIGVYATDSGTPLDENDEPTAWNLGPGRVIELPNGKKFWRVDGNKSFAPYQEHLKYLHEQIDATFGHSSVAKGTVDVSVAESGIALLLQLGPLLARAEEREVIIRDVHQQFLYGLGKWYTAYEGSAFNSLWTSAVQGQSGSKWMMKFGPKIPLNVKEEFDKLITLATSKPAIVPTSYIRDRLRKMGYEDMPKEEEIVVLMQNEATAASQTALDPVGQRADAEAEAFLA
jgi:hypothetical protein